MVKLFLALIVFFLLSSSVAYAQGPPNPENKLEELVLQNSVTAEDAEIELITKSCRNTQNQLKQIQLVTDSDVSKRLLLYSGIQKELKSIEIRITKQGADASELDLLIGDIQQDLDNFDLNSRMHSLLVKELARVDCQQEPLHFKAGIHELRAVRSGLSYNALQLQDAINNSQQTAFKPLIDRLRI